MIACSNGICLDIKHSHDTLELTRTWCIFIECFYLDQPRFTKFKSLMLAYSASRGHIGGLLLTWMPPRFFSSLSWKGSAQPPSDSGVASHSRSR